MSTVETLPGSRSSACSAVPELNRNIVGSGLKVGFETSGQGIDGIGEGWSSQKSTGCDGSGSEDVDEHVGVIGEENFVRIVRYWIRIKGPENNENDLPTYREETQW